MMDIVFFAIGFSYLTMAIVMAIVSYVCTKSWKRTLIDGPLWPKTVYDIYRFEKAYPDHF